MGLLISSFPLWESIRLEWKVIDEFFLVSLNSSWPTPHTGHNRMRERERRCERDLPYRNRKKSVGNSSVDERGNERCGILLSRILFSASRGVAVGRADPPPFEL